jgi:hypothetical protein
MDVFLSIFINIYNYIEKIQKIELLFYIKIGYIKSIQRNEPTKRS